MASVPRGSPRAWLIHKLEDLAEGSSPSKRFSKTGERSPKPSFANAMLPSTSHKTPPQRTASPPLRLATQYSAVTIASSYRLRRGRLQVRDFYTQLIFARNRRFL